MSATKEKHPGAATSSRRSSREALADTWFEVTTNLLSRIRAEATEEELERALAQPTSLSGLSSLLSRVAAQARLFDPGAPALVRGVREQQQLLAEAGGALSRSEVAEILEIQPAAVDQRRRRGRLLAVESLGGHFWYPRCQFSSEGTLPHLGRILTEFQIDSGWMRLDMLLSPLPALGARTPVQVLQSDPSEEELEDLLDIIGSWGA